MILACSYNVPAEERMFDRFRRILKEDSGLVLARGYPPEVRHPTDHFEVLVYESEETRIGLFRVHCSIPADERKHEFDFGYWEHRLTPEVIQEDPMKRVLIRFIREAKSPVEIHHMRYEVDIEELLKKVSARD